MRHEHDRDRERATQLSQFVVKPLARHPIDGGEGLVEQEHIGVARQRPRNGNPLLLAP